jgi:hypothetical protein
LRRESATSREPIVLLVAGTAVIIAILVIGLYFFGSGACERLGFTDCGGMTQPQQ